MERTVKYVVEVQFDHIDDWCFYSRFKTDTEAFDMLKKLVETSTYTKVRVVESIITETELIQLTPKKIAA